MYDTLSTSSLSHSHLDGSLSRREHWAAFLDFGWLHDGWRTTWSTYVRRYRVRHIGLRRGPPHLDAGHPASSSSFSPAQLPVCRVPVARSDHFTGLYRSMGFSASSGLFRPIIIFAL